jgi:hypothetical protein
MSTGNGTARTWRWAGFGVALAAAQAAGFVAVLAGGRTLSSQPGLAGALLYVALITPLVIAAGAGVLRRTTLIVWALAASVIAAGLGAWAELRVDRTAFPTGVEPNQLPLVLLMFAVLQVLVEAADAERRVLASYPIYFAALRRLVVQGIVATGFWAAVMLLVMMSRMLLGVVDEEAFSGVPDPAAVAGLVTAPLALTLANEALAKRPSLAPQLAAIILAFVRKLLPAAVLVTLGFFAAVAASGFVLRDPDGVNGWLYSLTMASLIILFVNAAYRDGGAECAPGLLVRWSARVAPFCIAGLAVIGGVVVWNNVAARGLRPEDGNAIAWAGVIAVYAAGYMLAAVRPGGRMRGVPAANLAGAAAIVAAIAALLTPLADPGRIAADDQYRRLAAGKPFVAGPVSLDVQYERAVFRLAAPADEAVLNDPIYGRFGREALDRLAHQTNGPHAAEIARNARLALLGTPFMQFAARPRPDDLASRIRMHPAGAALPKGFLEADWIGAASEDTPLKCLSSVCDAYLVDIDHDGEPELLMRSEANIAVFKRAQDGSWAVIGHVGLASCDDEDQALQAGRVKPVDPSLSDLDIGGRRYRIESATSCDGNGPSAPPDRTLRRVVIN